MLSRRPSPAMLIACLALFLVLGGTAFAAGHYLITSTRQIKPSVLATLRGAAGKRGPQGPQGVPGSPDTSQFYTKSESDTRYLQGGGEMTAIPMFALANTAGATVAEVAGVGKFEVASCGSGSTQFFFLNTSGGSEQYSFTSGYAARNDAYGDPSTGSLAARASIEEHGDAHDFDQLMVASGTQIIHIDLGQIVKSPSEECLYWGDIYRS